MSNLPTFQKLIRNQNAELAVDWRVSEIRRLRERYARWFTDESKTELGDE